MVSEAISIRTPWGIRALAGAAIALSAGSVAWWGGPLTGLFAVVGGVGMAWLWHCFHVTSSHLSEAVAAQRAAEAALETSERRFRLVADSALDWIAWYDPQGHCLYTSPACERITGYSREEFQADPGLELRIIHPADYALMSSHKAKAKIQQTSEAFCFRITTKSGEKRWIEHLCQPVYDETGRFLGRRTTNRDITARKKTEAELMRIREALDDCSSAVVVLAQDERVMYMNAAFGELFGVTPADTDEFSIRSIFAISETARGLFPALTRGDSWGGEVEMIGREHHPFTALLHGTPVLDEEFDVTGVMLILEDMTQRKHFEAQLRQSQNLKSVGQLAAGIAHEINTPMQYLGDNTRFLQDSFAGLLELVRKYEALAEELKQGRINNELLEEVERYAQEIDIDFLAEDMPQALAQSRDGIRRVSEITAAMKQFTHPGGQEKCLVDLAKVIQNTVTVARNEWRYVAEVEMDFAPDLPMVPCLPGPLNQVILNLVVNAAGAIADVVGDGKNGKGMIRISAQQSGEYAEIRVSDTGPGIPEIIRDRIFEPFFTTKEVGKGTGQGLAISHAVVVENHGGTLTFETTEGQGTTFIVRLPSKREGLNDAA